MCVCGVSVILCTYVEVGGGTCMYLCMCVRVEDGGGPGVCAYACMCIGVCMRTYMHVSVCECASKTEKREN